MAESIAEDPKKDKKKRENENLIKGKEYDDDEKKISTKSGEISSNYN